MAIIGVKKKQQAQNVVTCAKSHVSKLRHYISSKCILSLSWKCNCNCSVWIFLVIISEAISLIDLFVP